MNYFVEDFKIEEKKQTNDIANLIGLQKSIKREIEQVIKFVSCVAD